jgi:hypothetical protein
VARVWTCNEYSILVRKRLVKGLLGRPRSPILKEALRLRYVNKVLRRIFGTKGEELTVWSKLANEELHSLYSSLNVIRVIQSRKMKWGGHMEPMGDGNA